MWPEAARRGISRASFDTHTARLEPDVKIMDFVDAQPEFTRAFWEYLDLLVTDERLAKGREILSQHANAFAAAERAYGVDRHVIAAIWGIETKYGAVAGRSAGDPLDRDARLRRAAAGLLQGRVSRRAGNPASRRHPARAAERLVGRRVRPDAVHADRIQALRDRLRRRRAARRGRLGAGRDRLHRQSSGQGRMGHGPAPGATRSRCRRASTTCWPIRRGG